METFIGILIYLAVVILCYTINKKINISSYKEDEEWTWSDVRVNIWISIIPLLTIFYWTYILICKLPAIPEKPPRWL